MSRVLKFRAWDGEKMHENIVPWQWDFCISRAWHRCEKSTGEGILGSGGATGEFLVPGIRFKEIIQSTGLLDKNGVEIYESDRLNDGREVWIVCWVDDSACFGWYNEKNPSVRSDIVDNINTEVIGNIHEQKPIIS